MACIKTCPTPYIRDGTIVWSEGDIFTLNFELDLKDTDGETVILDDTSTVTVSVRRLNGETDKEFTIPGGNSIVLDFDKETTELFTKGQYRYDITVNNDYRVTVVNDQRMIVR